jgi:hypothetical protein
MWNDDDDDDFDLDKEHERIENLPIVKKADELYEIVMALIETFDIKNREGEDVPFKGHMTEEEMRERYGEPEFDEEDEDMRELDEEDIKSFGEHYRSMMMEDVMMISAKLRGAEGGDLYTLRMENATIIKMHARSLLTTTSGLKMMGLSNNKYLQLLRDEIEEFRKLFVEWINSFDKMNDIPDGWGMFYDPNIDYDSQD